MTIRFGRLLAWVVATALLSATPATAQGAWDPPVGFTPSPQPTAPAAPATLGPITFAEAEFPLGATLNGLVVNSVGGSPLAAPLSFFFSSADATINGGPGVIATVQIPNIEGNAADTMTIDFGIDVTRVAFGFAQSCGVGFPAAATVMAKSSGGTPVGSTMVAGVDMGFFFLENQVDFTPGSPFRSVDITFFAGCGRFAFDNLAYDVVTVPTMPRGAQLVLAMLLLSAGALVLRRLPIKLI